MKSDVSSRTAMLVAAGRAIATRASSAAANPEDWHAFGLLPRPIRALVQLVIGLDRTSPALGRLLLASTGGLIDHVALRGCLIDRCVVEAVQQGCRQVVIVGAGLDTRVQRLAALSEARVYEIDHPASQAGKRALLASRPDRMAATLVPIDLTTASLSDGLAAAGHQRDTPTLWVWEGVIAYLSPAQVETTVSAIASRSASGSQLVASYVEKGAAWPRPVRWLASALLPLAGEPLGTPLTRSQFGAILGAHRFAVAWDLEPSGWFERVGRGRRPSLYPYERLLLAHRID